MTDELFTYKWYMYNYLSTHKQIIDVKLNYVI